MQYSGKYTTNQYEPPACIAQPAAVLFAINTVCEPFINLAAGDVKLVVCGKTSNSTLVQVGTSLFRQVNRGK